MAAGCAHAATRAQDSLPYGHAIAVDGQTRVYEQLAPEVSHGTPLGLIIALHGYSLNAEVMRTATGIAPAAAARDAVVLFPQGINNSWNAGICCGDAAKRDVDDVAFVRALIKRAESQFTIDPKRVFLVGFSNGGMLAYRYLCEHPGDVSGIGVASATNAYTSASGKTSRCQPTAPAAIIAVNGLADTIVPFAGGYNEELRINLVPPAEAVVASSINNCRTTRKVSSTEDGGSVPAGVTIVDGAECAAGAQRLVTVEKLAHIWTQDRAKYGLDETAVILDWLDGHGLAATRVR